MFHIDQIHPVYPTWNQGAGSFKLNVCAVNHKKWKINLFIAQLIKLQIKY